MRRCGTTPIFEVFSMKASDKPSSGPRLTKSGLSTPAIFTIIGMYGPPRSCKRKLNGFWSAQMYSAFGGVKHSWP
jgi:hypothetical protein